MKIDNNKGLVSITNDRYLKNIIIIYLIDSYFKWYNEN